MPVSTGVPASTDWERLRLLRNWIAECESAVLYAELATLERDPLRRREYAGLAAAEQEHAAFWEARLRALGHELPPFRTSARTAWMIRLARWLGVGFVLPSITLREMRDHDDYAAQQDAQAAGLAGDEQRHAALLSARADRTLGSNLRAAVLGANDGLASNFCLMMGVAGAGVASSTILLTGIAGLVAGSSSMALGEWLSVTNARELAATQARASALDPDAAGAGSSWFDAWSAARVSFLLFALGALVPVLPFCIARGTIAIAASIALSLTALFVLGLTTALFNGRSALFSGARQVLIGAAAAALTYAVGRLVGAALA